MTPADCTAVVVTRGGYDISDVLESLKEFGEVLVWNNSEAALGDRKVYGRYIAAAIAAKPVVVVQDDDCIVDHAALCGLYEPGCIVCNMPQDWRPAYEGTGIALVGFGAIFDTVLVAKQPGDFEAYDEAGLPRDEVFLRECDRAFTYLNQERVKLVEVGLRRLPCAWDASRMWREPRHSDDLKEMKRRLAKCKAVAA